MKKFLLLAVAILISGLTMASDGFTVKYSENSKSDRQLSFTIGDYSIENVTIDGKTYSKIVYDHQITTKKKGWAELPFVSSSLQISNNKNVSVEVVNSEYTDIQLTHPLLPSRGVIYRNQDPSTIAYEVDPASMVDAFYPKAITTADEPYILRDIRGTNVKVFPFRYNAQKNILRVYSQVNVSVTDNNTTVVNPKTDDGNAVLLEMNTMYKSVFINYNLDTKEDLALGQYGDILVITTERDEEAIAPYIAWKKEKGFNVSKTVVETGTNVKQIVQDAYDANNNLLYVQLVGDWADIKSDLGGGANAPMDPMLGCVEGGDSYPELAIGRFSGSSPAQITVQVNKVITYEKTPQTDAAWYSHSLALGSSQGAGNGDDGEMDKVHVQIIYDNKLDPFTYDQLYTSYDPGANSNQVATAVNEGISIANYCGHGSQNSWVTSGFNVSDVNQLTNGEMLPILFSVACVNGAFHSGECFAEAWLKKEDGGAVIALMSTINQPWQPPMRGQDYFNDILTGGYDYDNNPGNGTNTEEGRSFIGSIISNGIILMYAESSGNSDLETIQTWTTFGDCSLQPRTIAPAELSLSSDVIISGVDYSTVVTSDGNPVEGAMVALSQGDLYYSAVTDENGGVNIPHELIPGNAKLVVTAYNTQTIYSDIVVISPDGPYMVIDDFTFNVEDDKVLYDSEISMNIDFKNLGSDPATDVNVTLTSEDQYCTLNTAANVNVGTVNADETVTVENAYNFTVSNDVPDQHTVNLSFDIEGSAKEVWQSNAIFKINAPALDMAMVQIDDAEGNGNGRIDAGETFNMIVSAKNIGHAVSPEGTVTVNSSSSYLTVNTASVAVAANDVDGSQELVFSMTAADDTPEGTVVTAYYEYTAGEYATSFQVTEAIGLIMDDFETGDFNSFEWEFNDKPWVITEDVVYEGAYSAKSADINHNESSVIELTYDVVSEGDMSFFYKVSSESGYDYLRFSINGVEKDSWSGEVAWTEATYTLAAGENILKWEYVKDYTATSGEDCAWIDYVILPASANGLTAVFSVDADDICDGETVSYTSSSEGATSWSWVFEGGTPATSTEENPTVTYATAGEYDVALTVGDGETEATTTLYNFMTVHNCTGVEAVESAGVNLYPNPNNGVFVVDIQGMGNASVTILNSIGSVVYYENAIATENRKMNIDLSQQAEGIYFVKVQNDKETIIEKIVLRK